MAAVVQRVRQHLIDPELCARCNGCEEACPNDAITHDFQNYAVNHALCGGCLKCVDACSTGAVDNWRELTAADPYSVEEQLTWTALPDTGTPIAEHGARPLRTAAPHSAAAPSQHLYDLHAPAMASVVENRQVTSSVNTQVHHIVLDFGRLAFPVLEGQSLSVIPPGCDAHGHAHHVRVYSVASPRDGELVGTNTVALTVKRVTEDEIGRAVHGVCSNFLCDLPLGSRVQVIGPSGATFLMPDDPACTLLMICTGTGIAPMRAMIERRKRLGQLSRSRSLLFYGGRTPREMPYFEEIAALASPTMKVYCALSRSADYARQYVQDLIREQAAEVSRALLDEQGHVYVCGLKGMQSGVAAALHDCLAARGHSFEDLLPELQHTGRYHVEVY